MEFMNKVSAAVRRRAKSIVVVFAIALPLLTVYILLGTSKTMSRSTSSSALRTSAVKSLMDMKNANMSGNIVKDKLKRRAPDFIIIGVRKCGTRALLSMMGLHPQVVSAGPEVHYFDRDENYMRGLDWYISQMAPARVGQFTGEKSPSYFIVSGVPARLKNFSKTVGKRTKLLLVVREPVSRVVSDFTQGLAQRGINLSEVERINADFSRKALTPDGRVNRNWSAIKISLYCVHLSRWFKLFDRSDIYIINGDNLIDSPAKEMTKVCKPCCRLLVSLRLVLCRYPRSWAWILASTGTVVSITIRLVDSTVPEGVTVLTTLSV